VSFRARLRTLVTSPIRGVSALIEPPAIALLYHRISHARPDTQSLCVTPEHFEQHLEVLAKEVSVISPADLCDRMKHGKAFTSPSVLITFDDGYADNAHVAVPTLEKHSLPALFFIATEFVGTGKEMWWDRAERCLFEPSHLPPELSLDINGAMVRFATKTPAELQKVMGGLHPILKYLRPGGQEHILSQLHRWSNTSSTTREAYRSMTWDELSRMASSSCVTIGSHSHTHTPFRILSEDEQRYEFIHSRTLLESCIGSAVTFFSFPYGLLKDYGEATEILCRQTGYTSGYANVPDHIHRWTSPYRIPRMLVRDWEKAEFRERLRSLLGTFPRV